MVEEINEERKAVDVRTRNFTWFNGGGFWYTSLKRNWIQVLLGLLVGVEDPCWRGSSMATSKDVVKVPPLQNDDGTQLVALCFFVLTARVIKSSVGKWSWLIESREIIGRARAGAV